MKTQLIIDCGGRVLTALLVRPDGEIVPVSQEIRGVATRHVSMDVLFDACVPEQHDFVWEDALESLGRARPRDFFQRARRIGLRRPWEGQSAADPLRIESPFAVLSSAAALADRTAARALPQFSLALLDALLEPVFTFVAGRQLAPADVDVILLPASWTGRLARTGLQKLVRRRGFRRATIVGRELAAALTRIGQPDGECIVLDSAGDDIHVHRIAFDGSSARTIRATHSSTLHGLGWSYWLSRIAPALELPASPRLDRALLALLTGSPESLPSPLTSSMLDAALDDAWVGTERRAWAARMNGDAPRLLVGEIFALAAVRRVFDASAGDGAIDLPARGIAAATRWLAADPSRTLRLVSDGTVRLDTLHGDAVELLDAAHVPAPGESCHVTRSFRFAGERAAGPFLLHLLWGTDDAPGGNATLAAVPLDVQQAGDGELRVSVHLRRSRNGALLNGTVEACAGARAVTAQFTRELEVRR